MEAAVAVVAMAVVMVVVAEPVTCIWRKASGVVGLMLSGSKRRSPG